MQCEEDGAVMHALHEGHGWSIARIAREFDLNWRTAKRYATSETAVRYPERERPAKLSEAQLAHLRRRLGVCPELRATTLYEPPRVLWRLQALERMESCARSIPHPSGIRVRSGNEP